MQTENSQPEDRVLWTIKDVSKTVAAAEPTIWEWCRKGKFPKPVKRGPRYTRWYSDEVIDWMNSLPRADELFDQLEAVKAQS